MEDESGGSAGVLSLAARRERAERRLASRPHSLSDVRVGVDLFKVQRGVYLLDLSKQAGDAFSFLGLCSRIITSLKMPVSAAGGGGAGSMLETNPPLPSPALHVTSLAPPTQMMQSQHAMAQGEGGGPVPIMPNVQVIAMPSADGSAPQFYVLNPETGQPVPLPAEFHAAALAQMNAAAAAAAAAGGGGGGGRHLPKVGKSCGFCPSFKFNRNPERI